jgi:hypothetical protein
MPERNFYAAEASLDVPQITAVYTNWIWGKPLKNGSIIQ